MLVAEQVTARFLNVIALFAGSIPIIAIQLNALRVSNQIVLDFVKVLDQRQLREDDTGEVGGATEPDVDRSAWEARVGAALMKACDRIAQIANEIADPTLELNYKKGRVALSVPGSCFNVLAFWPLGGHPKPAIRGHLKTGQRNPPAKGAISTLLDNWELAPLKLGDSVPKPLGFSAFRPEWLRSSRPACGGAQDSLKGAQDTRTPLAGFSVTLYGRFWGDH